VTGGHSVHHVRFTGDVEGGGTGEQAASGAAGQKPKGCNCCCHRHGSGRLWEQPVRKPLALGRGEPSAQPRIQQVPASLLLSCSSFTPPSQACIAGKGFTCLPR